MSRILLAAGALLVIGPYLRGMLHEMIIAKEIENYQLAHEMGEDRLAGNVTAGSASEDKSNWELYENIEAYNLMLYESGQSQLQSETDYLEVPEGFEIYESLPFGLIEIPAMDLYLPLYIGASDQHLNDGACVLGQTSIPIGGIHSNAVIAGHRGWKGEDFFLEIEKLHAGDSVYITNPWERLTYTVMAVKIILPDEVDAIRILDGKDMITLLTCHPYMSGGKYRYLVYCERELEADKGLAAEEKSEKQDEGVTDRWEIIGNRENETSEGMIEIEKNFRGFCVLLVLLMLAIRLRYCIKNRRKSK